jgi:cation diffusion facilitator CzcD-associated flavoprotein CzcO
MPIDEEGLSLVGAAGVPLGDHDYDADALRSKYAEERAKRQGNPYRGVLPDLVGDLARYLDDPYSEFTPRDPVVDPDVDVVVIGTGWAGLVAAVRMRELGVQRLRVIDKAGDVGGVWYWNRYPGVMCDVESYIYMPLLEELNYIPKDKYSKAAEIFGHAQAVAKKYDLYDEGLFQTAVTDLSWDEQAKRWTVSTDRGDDLRSRFVIIADGNFHRLKLPAIPGLAEFQGHSFHSSRWDYKYTGGDSDGGLVGLKGKRVGVIGTAATAAQIVPHLAQWADHLYVFQRTPPTVGERNNHPTAPDFADQLTPGWQWRRMRNFTSLVVGGTESNDLVDDGWTQFYYAVTSDPAFRERSRAEIASIMEDANFRHMEALRARIDNLVTDPAVAEKLKPWYAYFCTRPCFHDEYLPTFNRPNVTLVDTEGKGVERLTATAAVVGDVEYEVDCLIFSTGFEYDTSYTRKTGFEITGVGGRKISEKWADGYQTLHGFTTAGFPNLLISPGANMQATITHNVTHCLQEYSFHFQYIVGEVLKRGMATFDTDPAAETEWVQHIEAHARDNAAFLESCTPNRFNREGNFDLRSIRNANAVGSPLEFFDRMQRWRETGDLPGIILSR